jgi:hypothetical protein
MAPKGRIAARVGLRRERAISIMLTLQGLDELLDERINSAMAPFRWAEPLISRCAKRNVLD